MTYKEIMSGNLFPIKRSRDPCEQRHSEKQQAARVVRGFPPTTGLTKGFAFIVLFNV